MHFAKTYSILLCCGLNDKYTLWWTLNFLIMVVNCMGTGKLIFKSWFVFWTEENNCFPWNWTFSDLLASNFWALVDVMFHKPSCFLFWEMAIYVMLQHRLSILIMFQKVMCKVLLMHDASVSFSTSPQCLRLPLTSLFLSSYNFVMISSTWNLFYYNLVERPVWSSGCRM